jgi:hypothetical protein
MPAQTIDVTITSTMNPPTPTNIPSALRRWYTSCVTHFRQVACGSVGCRQMRSNDESSCAKIKIADATRATNPIGPLAGARSFTALSERSTCSAKSGDAWSLIARNTSRCASCPVSVQASTVPSPATRTMRRGKNDSAT